MLTSPSILYYSYDDLNDEEIEFLFLRYTKIRPDKTERIYGSYAVLAKDIMKRFCKITAIYAYVDILNVQNNTITVLGKDGSMDTICSTMMAEAFSGAEKLMVYIASVVNEKELHRISKDAIIRYCIDYYGVAMLAAVKDAIIKMENSILSQAGKKLTAMWSPGQAGIDLAVQQIIFNYLHPETVGILLKESLQMYPLNSVSGIAGVSSIDYMEKAVPCDYCKFALNCPGNCNQIYI